MGFLSGNTCCFVSPMFKNSQGVLHRALTRAGRFGGLSEVEKPRMGPFAMQGPNEAALIGARTTHPFNGSGDWIAENSDRIRKAAQQTEAGGPGAFGGGTKKENEELNAAQIATTNAVRNTYRLQDLIRDNPDALTATGRGVSISRAMANEAEAVARTFGVEIPEGLNDAARYVSTFEELGIDNARARGMLTNLAYTAAAANGQSGRSVSDRDVKRFLERIGGGYLDPQARVAVLDDFVEEIAEGFKTRYDVIKGEPFTGDLGLRGAGQATTATTREQWEALPSGTPYIDPTGKKRIKK